MEKYSPDKNMMVMTRDQVRSFDSWAINQLGIPGVVLMENAGRSCAEIIKEKLTGIEKPKVCIFCGIGNNGGDGYVIARHLLNSGFEVTVVICGDSSKIKGDAKINLDILRGIGQPIQQLNMQADDIDSQVGKISAGADILVDGLFGTGLAGQLRENYATLIKSINALNLPVVAVDIPSGLDCDSGQPAAGDFCAIRAKYTVTFASVKKGFVISGDANKYTGEIFVASIGIEPSQYKSDLEHQKL